MSWQATKRRVERKLDVAAMSLMKKMVLSFYFLAYVGFIANFFAQAKHTSASQFISAFILQLLGFSFIVGVVSLIAWMLYKVLGFLIKPFVS